jgi:transposase
MTDKRPIYTEEFTREAVRLVTEQGCGVAEAARNLGLNASMLGRWKRAVEQTMNGARLGPGRGALDAEEV